MKKFVLFLIGLFIIPIAFVNAEEYDFLDFLNGDIKVIHGGDILVLNSQAYTDEELKNTCDKLHFSSTTCNSYFIQDVRNGRVINYAYIGSFESVSGMGGGRDKDSLGLSLNLSTAVKIEMKDGKWIYTMPAYFDQIYSYTVMANSSAGYTLMFFATLFENIKCNADCYTNAYKCKLSTYNLTDEIIEEITTSQTFSLDINPYLYKNSELVEDNSILENLIKPVNNTNIEVINTSDRYYYNFKNESIVVNNGSNYNLDKNQLVDNEIILFEFDVLRDDDQYDKVILEYNDLTGRRTIVFGQEHVMKTVELDFSEVESICEKEEDDSDVKGLISELSNPKTGVKETLLYIIPLILLVGISLLINKDKIFKKI